MIVRALATQMKSVDLNALPYEHRFKGASLLIAKATRLSEAASTANTGRKQEALMAALAYYDMALALMKPYDPNYSTAVNWKCNALVELGQFEEAVSWYREIIRISDETDGIGMRNATAALAERMIHHYEGRVNEPLEKASSKMWDLDEPPYCGYAEEFCALLAGQQYKKAHAYLSPALKERVPMNKLKGDWTRMTEGAGMADLGIELQQHILDWPNRKPEEIGWCYFSVSGPTFNEAISVVVGRTPHNAYWITDLEFGRP